MASKSCRRKSAISVERAAADALLCNGKHFDSLSPDLEEAAEQLSSLGLIRCERQVYVKCCNTEDRDFTYSSRTCHGRVNLDDSLDEAGDEIRCTHCDRVIYPKRHNKQRFVWMRVRINFEKVQGYLQDVLKPLEMDIEALDNGLLRIPTGSHRAVHLCTVDLCCDTVLKSAEWARQNPTIYIVASDRAVKERFLKDESLQRISLAEVVSGDGDLCNLVNRLIREPLPTNLPALRTPVYADGTQVMTEVETRRKPPRRPFLVQVEDNRVFIDGHEVVPSRGKSQYAIFRQFYNVFLDDLADAKCADDFRFISAKELSEYLSDSDALGDEEKTRRYISRLRTSIPDKLRKSDGAVVDENDIIEIKPNLGGGQDEYGYRLNPARIAILPRNS